MTDPEKRGDPWKEALNCYNCFSDELIVVGEDWPEEFKFSQIGSISNKALINALEIGSLEWTLIIFFMREI